MSSPSVQTSLAQFDDGSTDGLVPYCGEADCGKPLSLEYEMVGRSCLLLLTCPVDPTHTSRLYQRPTRAEVA